MTEPKLVLMNSNRAYTGAEEELLCQDRIPEFDKLPKEQREAMKRLCFDVCLMSYFMLAAELGYVIEFGDQNGEVN